VAFEVNTKIMRPHIDADLYPRQWSGREATSSEDKAAIGPRVSALSECPSYGAAFTSKGPLVHWPDIKAVKRRIYYRSDEDASFGDVCLSSSKAKGADTRKGRRWLVLAVNAPYQGAKARVELAWLILILLRQQGSPTLDRTAGRVFSWRARCLRACWP